MQLTIPFSELKEMIKKKSGRSLDFDLTTVNDNTVKVSYEAKVKVKFIGEISKTFTINVCVDKIEGEDMYLSYDGGLGVNIIVGRILTLVSQLKNAEIADFSQKSHVVILHLAKIEEVHKVLQQIDIQRVFFVEDNVNIVLALKQYE